jgi:hypothetical protein
VNIKFLGFGSAVACLFAASMVLPAPAAQFSATSEPQTLMAQNTYDGGTASSQDSILQSSTGAYDAGNAAAARRQLVLAAETNLNFSAGFMHTQYHENLPPGTGDDENGFTAGFGVGASVLLPEHGLPANADLYTALMYEFSAGNLDYGGHFLISNKPAQATDRAVFNRIEARLGFGFPLEGGAELIPFLAAGYQAWNRNIETTGVIGTDEFYHSGLFGGGMKLDVPIASRTVLSATAETFALVGGGIALNNFDINHSLGVSAEERISLGMDYDISGPFHVFATGFWEHFNYAGFKPTVNSDFLFEPLSTTTQFGGNLGVAYSF